MIVNCNIYNDLLANHGVVNKDIYIKRDILSRFIGKFARLIHLSAFYNVRDFSTDDNTIIIFDDCIKEKRLYSIIAKKYGNKRLIFYYWNPVSVSINPRRLPSIFEKWSYSLTDCEKYGMRYNPTFSFAELFKNDSSLKNEYEYDVVFIGKDKGRKKPLEKMMVILSGLGYKCLFYITPNHPKICKNSEYKNLSYSEVLELTNRSKAILDFYKNPNVGFSLRVVEAVFMDKTLITNNIETLSFFSDDKRVINLSEISASKMNDTSSSRFDYKIKEYFDFHNWIKRFDL